MFEVRIDGRGGQGVVTAADLLSVAAFLEGKDSQAFPTFGSERMGAPITAFCRVSNKPIRSREPVAQPRCAHHTELYSAPSRARV
jgi:pyruvate ferredoxin oxidoreductase gamma subunit